MFKIFVSFNFEAGHNTLMVIYGPNYSDYAIDDFWYAYSQNLARYGRPTYYWDAFATRDDIADKIGDFYLDWPNLFQSV